MRDEPRPRGTRALDICAAASGSSRERPPHGAPRAVHRRKQPSRHLPETPAGTRSRTGRSATLVLPTPLHSRALASPARRSGPVDEIAPRSDRAQNAGLATACDVGGSSLGVRAPRRSLTLPSVVRSGRSLSNAHSLLHDVTDSRRVVTRSLHSGTSARGLHSVLSTQREPRRQSRFQLEREGAHSLVLALTRPQPHVARA
jgi:hypothetical protein